MACATGPTKRDVGQGIDDPSALRELHRTGFREFAGDLAGVEHQIRQCSPPTARAASDGHVLLSGPGFRASARMADFSRCRTGRSASAAAASAAPGPPSSAIRRYCARRRSSISNRAARLSPIRR